MIFEVIEFIGAVMPAAAEIFQKAKMISDTANKIKEVELDKAALDQKSTIEGEIDPALLSDIITIAGGGKGTEEHYIAKGLMTERFVNYALYYMTNHDAVKIHYLDNNAKSLINSIAELACPEFGKIYDEAGTFDLNKINSSLLNTNYDSIFILNLNTLLKRVSDPKFKTKVYARIDERKSKFTETSIPPVGTPAYDKRNINSAIILPDGTYIPAVESKVDIDYNSSKKAVGMSDTLFAKFENVFAPLFGSKNYHYTSDILGNYYVNIYDKYNVPVPFMIDDGTIMGGNIVSIMGNFRNPNNGFVDKMFINESHKNLIANICNDPYYLLNDEEIAMCTADMAEDGRIYKNIDFTNTGYIDSMTSSEKRDFYNTLSKAMNYNNGIRVRFIEFNNINDFTLISDNYCKSPIEGVTSSIIKPGFVMKVHDGILKLSMGDGAFNDIKL